MNVAKMLMPALMLGLALLALAGCDVFLAVKLGRWNPNDPANELVEVQATVIVDGWIDNTGFHDISSPELPSSDSNWRYSLIKFEMDSAALPENVVSARLYLTSIPMAGDNTYVYVNAILQPWDFSSLTWGQLKNPGVFYDVERVGVAYVEGALATEREYSWDLSGFFQDYGAGAFYGAMVSQGVMPMENRFFASETGKGPRLVVLGVNP